MAVTQSEKGFDIEIPLPEELQKFLAAPVCADISLPEPGNVKIELPSGGTIKGIGDITQGIPTNCSLNFSLMLQLGPILANLECFIRVLKLIKPLIDVIDGLPFPPAKALFDFAEAAKEVAECIVKLTTPLGMIPFVRDILCLIIRILSCMLDQMNSLLALMEKLTISFDAADGNATQQALLECAMENAQRSATAQLQAVEPVMVILEIAGPIFEIAQVGPVEIPTFEGVEGVEQMRGFVTTMEQFVDTLELLAEGLGGCG
ncbi:hypothetical protein E4634_01110 [Mangrovimicrobium sediminis]|uniref:Uncharacterized protein n=1 Tax=Mangrovimicrobium sediminis TaxID=2562682 RepID=A0A4Z0M9W0_9GAMM|nr:hypothetical protein [Haliea sp. SAOS-164]TGD76177.1 hypothetical protein E4634_01110 [Haliea sp. SAOS-164]